MLLEEGRSRRCATLRSRRVCQKRVPARHHAEVVVGRERERPHVGKERVPALLEEGRGGRRRRRDGGGVRAFLRLMAAAFAAALPATAQPAHHLILRGRGLCSAPLGHPVPRSGPGPSPGPNHDQDPQLVGSGRRPPCPCSDSLISSPCLLWFIASLLPGVAVAAFGVTVDPPPGAVSAPRHESKQGKKAAILLYLEDLTVPAPPAPTTLELYLAAFNFDCPAFFSHQVGVNTSHRRKKLSTSTASATYCSRFRADEWTCLKQLMNGPALSN